MRDLEGNTRQSNVANPYAGPGPQLLTETRLINILKRLVYMSISGLALLKFNFFKVVLRSPHVDHQWFKVGLACTIGTF
jgi:hypothetical protein